MAERIELTALSGAAADPDVEDALGRLVVPILQEDGLDLFVAQRAPAEVPHHADNLDGRFRVGPVAHADASADRILILEIAFHETLVHDHRAIGPGLVAGRTHVALVEVASGDELRADRRKEPGTDAHAGHGAVAREAAIAVDRDHVRSHAARQHAAVGDGGPFNDWHRLQALQHFAHDPFGIALRVSVRRRIE